LSCYSAKRLVCRHLIEKNLEQNIHTIDLTKAVSVTDQNNRIMQLEEEVAHLTKTNEELSSELLAQWKRVELLERKFAMMEQRFATLEDNMPAEVDDTRPPHW